MEKTKIHKNCKQGLKLLQMTWDGIVMLYLLIEMVLYVVHSTYYNSMSRERRRPILVYM